MMSLQHENVQNVEWKTENNRIFKKKTTETD